jgi:hypothetical protein
VPSREAASSNPAAFSVRAEDFLVEIAFGPRLSGGKIAKRVIQEGSHEQRTRALFVILF